MRRFARPTPLVAVLACAGVLVFTACGAGGDAARTPVPHRTATAAGTSHAASRVAPSPAGSSPAASSSTAPTTPRPTPRPRPAAVRRADATIARLTDSLGHRGVSIAVVDTVDGANFGYGARHGMLCASIAKLYILETLLLQHESGHPLGQRRRALATAMIEHSDNDAANDLYVDIGEGAGLRHAAAALGVHDTTPGAGLYWGYTRTGAGGYLALLRDLVGSGPLDRASRHYALHLLSHVESDQRWGVGSVAEPGTRFFVKNGWLAVSTDADRWAVNSVGIVTVHGHRLLMVVMTQHGSGFNSGVSLVDHLTRITAHVLTRR